MLIKQFQKESANRVTIHNPTMHKRNRAVQVLLLPTVVFTWIVGWSLYWIGSKKGQIKPNKKACIGAVALIVRMPEQKITA